MTKLPISICLFTSTKGHFGRSTYAQTLDDLHKQLPLSEFGALYAHIKITPNEEAIGAKIRTELEARGFTVEETVGSWQRGQSHGLAYLGDMIKTSQSKVIQSQPYMLFLEDDSFMRFHAKSLLEGLAGMVKTLENQDNVSARLVRRGDERAAPILQASMDHFYSADFNFQPALIRSRDWFIACKLMEDNLAQFQNVHVEQVVKIVLNHLTRNPLRHVVYWPEYAETIHIGTKEWLEANP